ncbi:hypothetical protein ACQUKI_00655 [Ralstonia pseudosolanacearum]
MIDKKEVPITLDEARAIAERNARADLQPFATEGARVLADGQLEAEACWMFFRSKEIHVPVEATLGVRWAYVVSKKGTSSMVQDFSGDPVRLAAYLEELSEHFKKRGE